MDKLTADALLLQHWKEYNTKHESAKLKKFLKRFVERYKYIIDSNSSQLNSGYLEEGPCLIHLPDGLLEALVSHLSHCTEVIRSNVTGSSGTKKQQALILAEKIMLCFLILCSNPKNLHKIAVCDFVSQTVLCSISLYHQVFVPVTVEVLILPELATSFLKHAIHVFECLYDPYFKWRNPFQKLNEDGNRTEVRPPLLNNDVVTFFLESLQKALLPMEIQVDLLHMFGAVMYGSKTNAVHAITRATKDVLLKVLSDSSLRPEMQVLSNLALKCIVRIVHTIHDVEEQHLLDLGVSEVVQDYMNIFLKLSAELDIKMNLSMLNMISELVACRDKSVLQVMLVNAGILNSLYLLLEKTTLTGLDAIRLTVAAVRVTQSILSGSTSAKALFKRKNGYKQIAQALRRFGPPSMEVVNSLLNLTVEDNSNFGEDVWVHNSQAAILLIQWLPEMTYELQDRLSECLSNLCGQHYRSRLNCCKEGMIGHIINVLEQYKNISPAAISHLIKLLETLGSLSITAGELKQLISLFRLDEEKKQMPYTICLMRAMDAMARRKEEKKHVFSFIDLYKPFDCIKLPPIDKWPGPAFSFYAWLCLDLDIDIRSHKLHRPPSYRRQLYIFHDVSGCGFEAFFTPTYDLVVAVYNKIEYSTISVQDSVLQDGLWHSVCVVHCAALRQRPLSKSQVLIYIDGKQTKAAAVKFPKLTQRFSACRVGSSPPRSSEHDHDVQESDEHTHPVKTKASTRSAGTLFTSGKENDYWGPPITLHGRISTMCVFSISLERVHVEALYASGPEDTSCWKENADLESLHPRLVASYSARACSEHECIDLSPQKNHGQITGEISVIWDIKDTINFIGGMEVLFPLLEQAGASAPLLKQAGSGAPLLEQAGSGAPQLNQADSSALQLEQAGSCTPLLEQAGSDAPLLEQADSSAPLLERAGLCAPLLKQAGSNAPLLEQAGSCAPQLEQAGSDAPLLEQADSSAPLSDNSGQTNTTMTFSISNEQTDLDIPVSVISEETESNVPLSGNSGQPVSDMPVSAINEEAESNIPLSGNSKQPVSDILMSAINEQAESNVPLSGNNGQPVSDIPLSVINEEAELNVPLSGNSGQPVLDILVSVINEEAESNVPLSGNSGQPVSDILMSAINEEAESNVPLSGNSGHPVLDIPVSAINEEAESNVPLSGNSGHPVLDIPVSVINEQAESNVPLSGNSGQPVLDILVLGHNELAGSNVPLSVSNGQAYSSITVPVNTGQTDPDMSASVSNKQGGSSFPLSANSRQTNANMTCSISKEQAVSNILVSLGNDQADSKLSLSISNKQTDSDIVMSISSEQMGTNMLISGELGDKSMPFSINSEQADSDILASLNNQQENSNMPESFSCEQADSKIQESFNNGQMHLNLLVSISNEQTESNSISFSSEHAGLNGSFSFNRKQADLDRLLFSSDHTDRKRSFSFNSEQALSDILSNCSEQPNLDISFSFSSETTSPDSLPDSSEHAFLVRSFLLKSEQINSNESQLVSSKQTNLETLDPFITYLENSGTKQVYTDARWSFRDSPSDSQQSSVCRKPADLDRSPSICSEQGNFLPSFYSEHVDTNSPLAVKTEHRILPLVTSGDTVPSASIEQRTSELPQQFSSKPVNPNLQLSQSTDNSYSNAEVFGSRKHDESGTPKPTKSDTAASCSAELIEDNPSDLKAVAALPHSTDIQLEQNQVAVFLTLIHHMLQSKLRNQEMFVRTRCAATIGALLQKVNSHQIDQNVFEAVRLMVTEFSMNKQLTKHLSKFILLDFRIWSKCPLQVQKDHIKFLLTVIEEDRQCLLEIIREHYKMNLRKKVNETFEVYLFALIRHFILKGITARELKQLKVHIAGLLRHGYVSLSQIYDAWREPEPARFHQNPLLLQNHRDLHTLSSWLSAKRFLTSEHGAWKERQTEMQHWKLSHRENASRMRVKTVPNFHFNDHLDASQQRDSIHALPEGCDSQLEKIKDSIEVLASHKGIIHSISDEEEWCATNTSVPTEDVLRSRKPIISEDVELITTAGAIKGHLEVTATHMHFIDCSTSEREIKDFKWALSQLEEIYLRHYNMQHTALEVFLCDRTNYFINFQGKQVRNKAYQRIINLHPQNLRIIGTRSPMELLKASGLTQKWVQREISNFDYLIQLNTIAGRTYNDLSQYPVFPWVLCDYVSQELDLKNTAVYRDLRKPLGIISPENEKRVKEKYEFSGDPSGIFGKKFHYGTHYSNAAGVMHYMVRMEPFTTLHIQLQDGKFDLADRQFFSISATWQALMNSTQDVKELIPEFFYLPEFLVNADKFDLGKLQSSEQPVDDVVLPRWAKSPEEFVYKNRQALESEFVSGNLNHWIDLIFGYKQNGTAAEEALNVFVEFTYEGAVTVANMKNSTERAAMEAMIRYFGQTPSQLLKDPHPKRLTFEEYVAKANKTKRPMSLFYFLSSLRQVFLEVSFKQDPLIFITVPHNQSLPVLRKNKMITLSKSGILGIHEWLPFNKKDLKNSYTFKRDASMKNPETSKHVGGPFAPGLKINSKLFAVSHDARLLFIGGHYDNSIQVYSLENFSIVNHVVQHFDIITCLHLDSRGHHLITGSRDTTCRVWKIMQQGGVSSKIDVNTLTTLYGHDQAVSVVYISTDLDLAVSASMDGTVILHTVQHGHYMRTLRPPCEPGSTLDISVLAVSDAGLIVLQCTKTNISHEKKHVLYEYSVNGKELCSQTMKSCISHMTIAMDHVVIGDVDGHLLIFQLFGLSHLKTLALGSIHCLSVTSGGSHILAGTSDGALVIIGVSVENRNFVPVR